MSRAGKRLPRNKRECGRERGALQVFSCERNSYKGKRFRLIYGERSSVYLGTG